MTRHGDSYSNIPKPSGYVGLVPYVGEGYFHMVSIIGDAEGLRYLAKVLNYMANVDVQKQDMPPEARAHIPLHRGFQLIEHSCEVEICRAEAKGSGDYPTYFPVKAIRKASPKKRKLKKQERDKKKATQ